MSLSATKAMRELSGAQRNWKLTEPPATSVPDTLRVSLPSTRAT
ncbi:MAG: hypothetical protein U1F25_03295 [Rubrivivax sp.]